MLFDGDFDEVRASGPFAWKLHESDVGGSEMARDGSESYLDVRYHGGRSVTLVEQITALKPGRYDFKSSAKTDTSNNSASFSWQISCMPDGGALSKLDLARLSNRFSQFSTSFEVPAGGCAGQKLALVAEPGEIAGTAGLQVAHVEVTGR
jgi:hypothetical protein